MLAETYLCGEYFFERRFCMNKEALKKEWAEKGKGLIISYMQNEWEEKILL